MTQVTTVLGPVATSDLGIALVHEHVFNDASSAWRPPADGDTEGQEIAHQPIRMRHLGRLRVDPYLSLDNTRLDDQDLAAAELGYFAAAGGRTVVDQTPAGLGRDPAGLYRVSRRTGLHVVMGCGYYLERAHPPEVATMSVEAVAESVERDLVDGVDGVRAGVIGEIGVSGSFTGAERKVLRGAARAQRRRGVPLSVHLPGWRRLGHDVLDTLADEGVPPDSVVLSHLNPSQDHPDYQRSLAARGAWIAYDMVGIELRFPGEGQSPSDADNARAVAGLIRDGYEHRLLLSHDVFLKTLLRAYGGYGYAHLLTDFAKRLAEHGVDRERLRAVLVDNPRHVFETACEGSKP